ncbi:MAG: trypsin-like peptidase domain-containing protein [Cyanobacteriota bacterium]|nr:trypsin-like peptidase domain-containing protein [Cyanobacteriota bacterium]
MNKKLLALFVSGFLFVTLLGNWTTVQAQTSQTEESSAIALPFDADADGSAFVPSDRQQSDQPYDDSRVIIGRDDRAPVLSRHYPWSAIGRLEQPTADGRGLRTCTGTLIGRDLVLTNSHCIVDDKTNRPTRSPITFKPSMINGVSLDEATVTDYDYGWKSGSQNSADDWAVLKLDQPLGDIYGYLGWRSLDFSDADVRAAAAEKVMLAGYSGDFPTAKLREFGRFGTTAGVDGACSILDAANGLLFHDCDTNPGASGSAILGLFDDNRYYILGLHAGSNELGRSARLPDGTITGAINRGLQVPRWAARAAAMRS